jgi:hypothetical protein
MFSLILTALLLLQSSQVGPWQVYSPPDAGVSIESPTPLRRVRWYEGEHGIGDNWTTKAEARGGVVYVAQESVPYARDYAVLALYIPKAQRPLSKEQVEYLKWWIGGDDESEPTSVGEIEVKGVKGKEYVYAHDIALNRFTRGRIFDGGDRVFILIFKSSIPEDLSSDSATRFLNSFRIRRRR